MGDAQRGDDALYFFAANLGDTRKLEVISANPVQLPDNGGRLTAGRYLLHISDLSGAGRQKVWVRLGKWGTTIPIEADVPAMPLQLGVIAAIEINVRKNDNDQIAAITSEGDATLYVTQISRGA
jgi:hypothetical protein